MAASSDQIQSLAEFTDIKPFYSISDDMVFHIHVDPNLDTSLDRVGLYRVGWFQKSLFIFLAKVHTFEIDSFGERQIILRANTFGENIREDIDYEFCYFHPFGDRKKYELCGRSDGFRFWMSDPYTESKPNECRLTPEMARIGDPLIALEKLDINPIDPKCLLISRQLSEQKERFDRELRIKDLEMEKLRTAVRLSEQTITSLEYELHRIVEFDNDIEDIENNLMNTTIETSSLGSTGFEEQLNEAFDADYIPDYYDFQIEEQCSSKNQLTDESKILNGLNGNCHLSEDEGQELKSADQLWTESINAFKDTFTTSATKTAVEVNKFFKNEAIKATKSWTKFNRNWSEANRNIAQSCCQDSNDKHIKY